MTQPALTAWIINDDLFYREALIGLLSRNSYVTRTFVSGEAFLELLQNPPDLLIVDHAMSRGLSGWDILHHLKTYHDRIPVIYLSGEGRITRSMDAFRYPSLTYIEKDNAVLIQIEAALQRLESSRRLRKWHQRNIYMLVGGVALMLAGIAAYLILRYLS